ncbi:porin [Photobacterium frigidiphilum]|uniref:Porin n=1 Tax=Photobacterium frigidiphilum TaxID=264736 RepID=A0A2T3JRP4_9GAMM|nr:porin [Photobacterium frigidiphilum]PSU51725.1 porin [Photobacterium frigidiphilum]
MKNMFKRSILGAAIATAAMASVSANAYTIGESNDSKVEVYGIVSISAVDYGKKDEGFVLENESRVGFRAAQAMTDNVEAFVQIESGWVLDEGADLGHRDTFVGMRGDSWGAVRFGRMLTPMYELVDWPYSASNMGTTFDRGWRSGERFLFDRKSQQVRFDSINYADMVNFSLSVGNGSSKTDDSTFYGAKVSVTPVNMLTLHAAFESATDTIFATGSDAAVEEDGTTVAAKADSVGDTDSFFAGFELRPMDSLMIAGAYKTGEYDADTKGSFSYDKREIDAYSIQANYYMGNANFRLGYANQTGDTDGQTDKELDFETVTGEFGYSFNSVYTFLRIAEHSSDGEGDTMVRVGTEWYF